VPGYEAPVFGADHPVDTDNASTLAAEGGWTSAQWKTATLDYADEYEAYRDSVNEFESKVRGVHFSTKSRQI
jgi:hypothetical protein